MADNRLFFIKLHWDEDIFSIDQVSPSSYCFKDLVNDVHRQLKVDMGIKLEFQGSLLAKDRISLSSDSDLTKWFEYNGQQSYIELHLFVDYLNQIVPSSLDDPIEEYNENDLSSEEDADEEGNQWDDFDLDDEFEDDFLSKLSVQDQHDSIAGVTRIVTIDQKKKQIGKEENESQIQLERGMVFPNVDMFRQALSDYVTKEDFDIVMVTNKTTETVALCSVRECGWFIHASTSSDGITFEIKVYKGKHTCSKRTENSKVSSDPMSSEMDVVQVLSGSEWKNKHINRSKRSDLPGTTWMMLPLERSRKEVLSHARSYGELRRYTELLGLANPGSMVKLEVDRNHMDKEIFRRLFLCLDAMKMGFLAGCRPIIGLDGFKLKGPFGGVLLAAISIDGNNGIFPVAFAVVRVENLENWTWFLESLESLIGPSREDKPLVFMSDRQNGLPNAISKAFRVALHRCCCRHLYNNIKRSNPGLLLKTLFVKAAETYCPLEFAEVMSAMDEADGKVSKYLNNLGPETWARHAFDPRVKSDHITNNMLKAFNQWVGELKGKPVLTMVESLVAKIMGKLHVRYELGCIWQTHVTPKAIMKLSQIQNTTQNVSFVSTGCDMEFLADEDGKKFHVDLRKRTCACNFWAITGFPCKHAITCIIYLEHDMLQYCDKYYNMATYKQIYDQIIHDVHNFNKEERFQATKDIVLPPAINRLVVKPKKSKADTDEAYNKNMEKIIDSIVNIIEDEGENNQESTRGDQDVTQQENLEQDTPEESKRKKIKLYDCNESKYAAF